MCAFSSVRIAPLNKHTSIEPSSQRLDVGVLEVDDRRPEHDVGRLDELEDVLVDLE